MTSEIPYRDRQFGSKQTSSACANNSVYIVDMRRLADLNGVGPATLDDLERLGIRTVEELAARDARELYDELCRQTGKRQDPCVQDVFACAIAQARDPQLPAEQQRWWYWTKIRKAAAS